MLLGGCKLKTPCLYILVSMIRVWSHTCGSVFLSLLSLGEFVQLICCSYPVKHLKNWALEEFDFVHIVCSRHICRQQLCFFVLLSLVLLIPIITKHRNICAFISLNKTIKYCCSVMTHPRTDVWWGFVPHIYVFVSPNCSDTLRTWC